MSLVVTCLELANGDEYEALLAAVEATRLGVDDRFRVCPWCGGGFTGRHPTARFCSERCRVDFNVRRRPTRRSRAGVR